MSADNYMAVIKEGDKYVGYHCSASVACEQPNWLECHRCTGTKHFSVDTIEEAIQRCEDFGYLEYGYRFVDFSESGEFDKGFCAVCAHNPDLPEEGGRKAKKLGCTCLREKRGDFYCYKMGKDCPVHFNIEWQKRVGIRSY